MANYSADTDLELYEPNIQSEAEDEGGYDAFHEQAKSDIDRILKADWYPSALRRWSDAMGWDVTTKQKVMELPFDSQYLVTPDQLKAASCFRVLGWYVYETLAKYSDAEPDRYEKKKEVYRDRFREEMALVLAAGLDYDFSQDGSLSVDETAVIHKPRRARRA